MVNTLSVEELELLALKFNYQMLQINGQRTFVPLVSRPIPERGTEVFVGNIPKTVGEDTLFPLFLTVGPIYQMRVMVDFTGACKGFAFVSYYTQEHANKAIKKFHQHELRPKKCLIVALSLDNRRLFVGNIPKDKTVDEIRNGLEAYMDEIVQVIVHKDFLNQNLNRGYVFVEFESHRAAYMARRKLYPGVLSLWGHQLSIDWADPIPILSADVLAEVKVVYLKNLPVEWSNKNVRESLRYVLGNDAINKIYKNGDWAFVHFDTKLAAEIAIEILNGYPLNNKIIKAEWARPAEYSKENRLKETPDHYCSSMPPRARRQLLNHIRQKKLNGNKSGSISWLFNSANDLMSETANNGNEFASIDTKPARNDNYEKYLPNLNNSVNLFNIPTNVPIFPYCGESLVDLKYN